jgi:hypothetical protein
MLKFAQKRGFKIHYVTGEDDTVHIALKLWSSDRLLFFLTSLFIPVKIFS